MAVKQIVYNKKANFEYEILEKYEAGIVLQGTEVKSIKAGKCSIGEAYLIDKDEELFIKGMNISEYSQGNIHNHEPLRIRKLLLHKKEILKGKYSCAVGCFFERQSRKSYDCSCKR